jgi:hypothetical protein
LLRGIDRLVEQFMEHRPTGEVLHFVDRQCVDHDAGYISLVGQHILVAGYHSSR